MKKHIDKIALVCTLLLLIISFQDMKGQVIEMNGFAGWQFGGTAKLYDGELRIDDAMNYGGKLAVGLSTTTFVEFSYTRSDTEGKFVPYYTGSTSDQLYFSSNYIHLGGLQEAHFGPLAPFATFGLGLVVWSPKDNNTVQLNSKTQFSMTFGAGVKIWFTKMLGIRLQGSMFMPMVWNGAGFGCGIGTGGSGCSSSVYTRITPFQGEFSGGIILKFTPR